MRIGLRAVVDALREQRLVANDEVLAREIARVAKIVRVPASGPRATIIEQDESGNDLFMILSGRVSILVNGREVAVRDGGLHVGEMAILESLSRRSATVIAREPTILARVGSRDFLRLAESYPVLWRRIAVELSRRLRQRARFHCPANKIAQLFIGSSREGLSIARALASGIGKCKVRVRVWNKGVFRASATTLEGLESAVSTSDFAVLVLLPEDLVTSREDTSMTPRDNCIFELGLFMSGVGRSRTFAVVPRVRNLKLPSDLLGMTRVEFAQGTPATLARRLSGSVRRIRKQIGEMGPR